MRGAESIIVVKCQDGSMFDDGSFTCSTALGSMEKSVAFCRAKETKLREHQALCLWRPQELDPAEYLAPGLLGDKVFLGVVGALLNADPRYVDVLFSISRPALGAHAIRFYVNSKWKLVTVDDRLPFVQPAERGELAFGHVEGAADALAPVHMWVPVLEKAFAKLYGSYQGCEAASLVREVLYTLTGTPVLMHELAGAKASAEPGAAAAGAAGEAERRAQLWAELVARRAVPGSVVVAVRTSRADDGCGVACQVPYTLLAAEEAGGERVCVLRPGLGCPAWTGRYARGSAEFAALPESLRRAADAAACTAVMPFDEVCARFTELDMLVLPVPGSRGPHSYTVASRWAGRTAGGAPPNVDTWRHNPQFSVVAEDDCDVTVVVSQLDATTDRMKYQSIGCVAARTLDPGTRKTRLYTQELLASTGTFLNCRDATFAFHARAHQAYVVVPSTYLPNKEGAFFLRICSDKALELRDLSEVDTPADSHSAAPPAGTSIPPPPAAAAAAAAAASPLPPQQEQQKEQQQQQQDIPPPAEPPKASTALTCSECGKAIESEYYMGPGSSAPICPACYERTATLCPVCNQMIPNGTPSHTFEGVRYHIVCFHCQTCNRAFGPEGPRTVNGKLCCANCASPCAGCGKCIAGTFISFNDKKYHENCFICSQCKQVISGNGEIFLLGDDPVCAACAQKLQG